MVERDASERPGVLLLRRSRAKVIQSARPGKIVTIWNKSGSDSELDAQKYDGHKFKRISSFIVRPSRYRDMDISLTFTKKKKNSGRTNTTRCTFGVTGQCRTVLGPSG